MSKSTKRRGTVLVLILGALALISIITLVYVSIGQSDRRTAAVTVRNEHVDTVGQRFTEYAARVIADATFATSVDGQDGPNPVLVRRMADFPFVDPIRQSVVTGSALQRERLRFDPTGSYSVLWWLGGIDRRVAGSPYLASPHPTWFPPAGFTVTNPPPPPPLYDEYRDLYSITNIAPDGSFVNLRNLRNNFDARPRNPNNPNNPVQGDLTFGLSLLDENGQPTQRLAFSNQNAEVNTPAHWTLFQRRAHRPVTGPWYNNQAYNRPDSIHYPHNQWADTNGDGFFDSRWFELIDATDPGNILSFLPRDNRYRWFAAVRIVDLSSKVNVNTATDFVTAPRAQRTSSLISGANTPIAARPVFPVGKTPAEIDLRRLLLMTDAYWNQPNLNQPWGYQLLVRPGANVNEDPYLAYNAQIARDVGNESYKSLSRWLRPWYAPDHLLSADERLFYYEDSGVRTRAHHVGNNIFEITNHLSDADLLELLSHVSMNSPTSSRLEEVLGGQGDGPVQSRLSPLRDNRSAYQERDGLTPQQALARSYFDVRQFLTTISGARPLRPSMMTGNSPYRRALHSSIDEAVNADLALRNAVGLNVQTPGNDPSVLFRAYADGLLPHSWRQNAWMPTGRTLHYGGDPELALRAAAHLTANMAAAYGTGIAPSPYTLLLAEDFRNTVDGDPEKYPWWTPRTTGATSRPRSLDLNGDPNLPSRLPPNATSLSAGAVNIWGIKPQPFITNMTSFHLYTDAPINRAGGDQDWDPDWPAGPRVQITIAGGASNPFEPFQKPAGYSPSTPAHNPDYIGQFVAFQLTNPFEVEINLTGAGQAGYTDYYIEFGEESTGEPRLFQLRDFRIEGQNRGAEMRLRAGETRVVVIMSHTIDEIVTLWNRLDGTTVTRDTVLSFIDRQMSVERAFDIAAYPANELTSDERVRPWIGRRMDPQTGEAIPLPGQTGVDPVDLFRGNASVGYLWRKVDDGPYSVPLPGGGNTVEQYRAQHYLADRLRDPAAPGDSTLDRRLRPGNHNISGTESGPEDCPTCDNRGFTIALWGSVTRRANPQRLSDTPLGAIPAYCVEARWGVAGIPGDAAAGSTNATETDGLTGIPSRADFINRPNAAETFSDWLDDLTFSGGDSALVVEVAQLPGERITNRIQGNRDGRPYIEVYPQILLNNNRFRLLPPGEPEQVSVLRVADMLLPLAIGPSHDPEVPSTPQDRYAGWITLSEALSIALNYSAPPQPTGGSPDPFDIWYNIGDPNDVNFYALDRGHLLLDRFVPYENIGNVAHTRFPGIPLALHLLNVFTVPGGKPGSITEKTPGLVNINTASLPVLRTIPLLTPTSEFIGATRPAAGSPDFVWNDWKIQSGLTLGTVSPLPDLDTDIAASLQAYRDKLPVFDRGDYLTNDPQFPNFFHAPDELDLLHSDPALTSAGAGPQRALRTDIFALREAPGISTRGEIMAVRTPDKTDPQYRNSMDVLAADLAPSGTVGTATALYHTRDQLPVPDPQAQRLHNEIPDSYDEALLIANAAMGSISVRSDVFAVWIVLHGYQRSDVENLRDEDPLTPSIARRYLMVVDRSNVTRKGQMPEIVLLKELPIR